MKNGYEEVRQEAILKLTTICLTNPSLWKEIVPILTQCALRGAYETEQRRPATEALVTIAAAVPEAVPSILETLRTRATRSASDERIATLRSLPKIASNEKIEPGIAAIEGVIALLTDCAARGSSDSRREAIRSAAVLVETRPNLWRQVVGFLSDRAMNGASTDDRVEAVRAIERVVTEGLQVCQME